MYYPDVPALEPDELNLLCNEYMEHNATLDPHLADQMGVKRGLRNLDGTGVLAGITNVSNVIGYDKKPDGTIAPIPGRLVYRGIDIDTLAAEADAHDRFMFEEVIWLLLFGSLPTQEQYAKFRKLLDSVRSSKDPWFYTILAFITPGLPNGIIPYAAANAGMRPKQFLAAIFISLPFPTLLTCAAGSFILEGNWMLTVLVGVVLFSFVGILFFNRARLIARAHQLNDNRKKKAGA